MKKRLLAMMMAFVMAMSLLPVSALAKGGDDAVGSGTKLDWKQFYGYTANNTMSSVSDNTAGKCTVYLGDAQ